MKRLENNVQAPLRDVRGVMYIHEPLSVCYDRFPVFRSVKIVVKLGRNFVKNSLSVVSKESVLFGIS